MTAPVAARGRVRLHFLDGIRGLAALYVLVFHSLTIDLGVPVPELSPPMRALRAVFGYGHFAVAVFIVLSGFSLMIPIAQRNEPALTSSFREYLRRRSRRVLPAYYAALVLSIAAIVGAATLFDATDAQDEALSPGSIVSHVFLVHNWWEDWVFRINGPMWSVATEWQIYFLFPLVLLPLWRRIGPAATTALVWAIAFAVHFGVPADRNLDWAAPWFVGSFALGMWGAWAAYRTTSSERCDTRPWSALTIGMLTLLVAALATRDLWWTLPVLDLVVSIGGVAGILACVRAHRATVGDDRRPVSLRFLESRSVVWLGAISYSTYLLQHPLLRLTEQVLSRAGFGVETAFWIQLIVGTPAILAASWFFAEFFELPFTTGSHLLPARWAGGGARPARRPADTSAGPSTGSVGPSAATSEAGAPSARRLVATETPPGSDVDPA